MQRILKNAGSLCKALFVLALIYMIIFLITQGMSVPLRENKGDFDIYASNFGKNPKYLSDANSNDVKLLYESTDFTDKTSVAQTAYDIYSISLKRLALLKGYGSRIKGTIDFTALSIKGVVSTIQINNIKKIGEPTLSATQPYSYFYQNIISLESMEGAPMLESALQGAITKGVRTFSDGKDVYKQNGTSPYVSPEGGNASWSSSIEKLSVEEDTKAKRKYNESDLREKSNYIINMETILSDTVVINVGKDENNDEYYDISFNLDCSSTDEGSAVYYEALSITSIVGNNLSLIYSSAKVNMRIYANGYMTRWSTNSAWQANFSLGKAFTLTGTADMRSEETISYDETDVEVLDFRSK